VIGVAGPGCPCSTYGDRSTKRSTTGAFIQMSRLSHELAGILISRPDPRPARVRDTPRAPVSGPRRHAKAAAEQIDLQLARVQAHARCRSQAECRVETRGQRAGGAGFPAVPGRRSQHGACTLRADALPRVIVTGASGFCRRAPDRPSQGRLSVVGIARRSQRRAGVPEHPHLTWLEADIAERPQLERAFRTIAETGGADYVVHLAAYYDFTGLDHPEYARTNVDGLRNVLDLCTACRLRRFIFASSLAACRFRPTAAC
jgi:hypothetical protein